MPFAYSYGRPSATDLQKNADASARQEAQAKLFWEERLQPPPLSLGWAGWFTDLANSGSTAFRHRTAASVLMRRLDRGDHLAFFSSVTAFRSLVDQGDTLATLTTRNITPHFIDHEIDGSTEAGVATLKAIAAAAETEKVRISERQKDSSADRKRQGLAWSNNPPWGFKTVKRKGDGKRVLEFNEREIEISKRAYELINDGATYERTWRIFRLQGLRGRTGGDLLPSQIFNMVQRFSALLLAGDLPECHLPMPPASSQVSDRQSVQI